MNELVERITYNPQQVAAMIGCHVRTVWRALNNGNLYGRKINGRWHVMLVSALEWQEERQQGPGRPQSKGIVGADPVYWYKCPNDDCYDCRRPFLVKQSDLNEAEGVVLCDRCGAECKSTGAAT